MSLVRGGAPGEEFAPTTGRLEFQNLCIHEDWGDFYPEGNFFF